MSAPVFGDSDIDSLDALSRINNRLLETQRELARVNASLSRTHEANGLLISTFAHDLHTPLNVIDGYAQLLEHHCASRLPPKDLAFIQRIHQASEYMKELIEDLATRVRLSDLTLQLEEVDLAALVCKVSERVSIVARGKGVDLRTSLPAENVMVQADRLKLERVIANIVDNALKYSFRGGRVDITLSRDDDRAVLTVSDTGTGIAPEIVPLLFRPFSRGATRGTGGEPATGLGLFICKQMVDAHGGTIAIDSAHGRGTTVTVTLPSA